MKIGVFGFGKTGKAVAAVVLQHKHFSLEWVVRQNTLLEDRSVAEFLGITSTNTAKVVSLAHTNLKNLFQEKPVDVIIDFSSEQGIYTYGEIAASLGIKIVSAISHYSNAEIQLLKTLSNSTAVFWSANITLGVNYLIFAGKFLQKIAPWVDVEIVEEHFKGKQGVSGTALKIADALHVPAENINTIRAGGIVGKHEVIFGFPYQTVRLTHESISREAFGNGALFVAENLLNKPNGFYNFEDILLPYFVA